MVTVLPLSTFAICSPGAETEPEIDAFGSKGIITTPEGCAACIVIVLSGGKVGTGRSSPSADELTQGLSSAADADTAALL